VGEQRALADARLAPQDRDPAAARTRVVQQPLERVALGITPKQRGPLTGPVVRR
jgi:hypothetical protein